MNSCITMNHPHPVISALSQSSILWGQIVLSVPDIVTSTAFPYALLSASILYPVAILTHFISNSLILPSLGEPTGWAYKNYSKGFLVADYEPEDTKARQSNDDTNDEDSEDDDDTDESDQEIKLTDRQISEDFKKGRACAQSILGIIATGDASIEEAKLDAGIKKVFTVSHETLSVLNLYAQICTVIAGI